jgi:hypothetical protein
MLLFFRQKIGSCPPPGKFLPFPGKKSADAHVYVITLLYPQDYTMRVLNRGGGSWTGKGSTKRFLGVYGGYKCKVG